MFENRLQLDITVYDLIRWFQNVQISYCGGIYTDWMACKDYPSENPLVGTSVTLQNTILLFT